MAVATSTFDSVFVTATDTAYVPGTDEVKGVKDLSIEETRTMTESTYLGDAFTTFTAGVKSVSISLSGHFVAGDLPQKTVRDAHGSGATIYLSIVRDPGGVAGQKGHRFPVLVESYSTKLATGDVIAFDAKFSLAGTPTAI